MAVQAFSERFFSLSTLPIETQSDDEIRNLLDFLATKHFRMKDDQAIYGPRGEYWPVLIQPNGATITSGTTVAAPGSRSIGAQSVKEYLQRQLEIGFIQDTSGTQTTQQRSFQDPRTERLPERTAPAETASQSDAPPSYAGVRLNDMVKQILGGGNVVVLGASFSPEDVVNFMRVGFSNATPEQKNYFTAAYLTGASLTIYQTNQYILIKDKKILALSEGLVVLPVFSPGFYRHSQSMCSDEPCDVQVKTKVKLTQAQAEAALPYLNALNLYTG